MRFTAAPERARANPCAWLVAAIAVALASAPAQSQSDEVWYAIPESAGPARLVDIAATAGLHEIALLDESGALVLWRRPANKVELLWDVPADAPKLTARRLTFEAATKTFVVELSIDEEQDDADEPASARKPKQATAELKPQRIEAGGFTIDARVEKADAAPESNALKCDPRKALTAEQRRQLFRDYARETIKPVRLAGGGTAPATIDARGLVIETKPAERVVRDARIERAAALGLLEVTCSKTEKTIELIDVTLRDYLGLGPWTAPIRLFDPTSGTLATLASADITGGGPTPLSYVPQSRGAQVVLEGGDGRVSERLYLFGADDEDRDDFDYAILSSKSLVVRDAKSPARLDLVAAGARKKISIAPTLPSPASGGGSGRDEPIVLDRSTIEASALTDPPAADQEPIPTVNRNPREGIACIAISADARIGVTMHGDGMTMSVWDLETRSLLRSIQATYHRDTLYNFALSPSGRYAVVSAWFDDPPENLISRLFDLVSGEMLGGWNGAPNHILTFLDDHRVAGAISEMFEGWNEIKNRRVADLAIWSTLDARVLEADIVPLNQLLQRLNVTDPKVTLASVLARGDKQKHTTNFVFFDRRHQCAGNLQVTAAGTTFAHDAKKGLSVAREGTSEAVGRPAVDATRLSVAPGGRRLVVAANDGTLRSFAIGDDFGSTHVLSSGADAIVDVGHAGGLLATLHKSGRFALWDRTGPASGTSFGRRISSAGDPVELVALPDGRFAGSFFRFTGVKEKGSTREQGALSTVVVDPVTLRASNASVTNEFYDRDNELTTPSRRIVVLDKDTIAVLTGGALELWQAGKRVTVAKPTDPDKLWNLQHLKLSPDGRRAFAIAGTFETHRDQETWNIFGFDPRNPATPESLSPTQNGYPAAAETAPDGRYYVVGLDDGAVRLFDLRSKELVWDKSEESHAGKVIGIATMLDGRIVVTLGEDGAVIFRAATDGRKLATLRLLPDKGWIVFTPEGVFAGSANLANELRFTQGLASVAPDQVAETLRRPDLVKRVLDEPETDILSNRRDELNLKSLLRTGAAPGVRIRPGTRAAEGADRSLVEFDVDLIDRGGGIGRIEVFIDNGKVEFTCVNARGSARGHQVIEDCDKAFGEINRRAGDRADTVIVTVRVPFAPGENRVRVLAYNGRQLVRSLPDERVFVSSSEAKPRLFVLSIGVDSYAAPGLTRLKWAKKDATDIAAVMQDIGRNYYDDYIPMLLTEGDATRTGIEAAFAKLRDAVKPSDAVVIFAAGHGVSIDNRFVYLPYGFAPASGDTYAGGLDSAFWTARLSSLPSRKMLVVFDTCDSGAFGQAMAGMFRSAKGSELLIAEMQARIGRAFIAAARATQQALEGVEDNGALTYVLKAALDGGADVNSDTFVSVGEMASYVNSRLPIIVRQHFKREQTPLSLTSGDFVLGRARAEAGRPGSAAGATVERAPCTLDEQRSWDDIAGTADEAKYRSHLERFPEGCHALSAALEHGRLMFPAAEREKIVKAFAALGRDPGREPRGLVETIRSFQRATGRAMTGALSPTERTVVLDAALPAQPALGRAAPPAPKSKTPGTAEPRAKGKQ